MIRDERLALDERIDAAHALSERGDPRVSGELVTIPAGQLLHRSTRDAEPTAIDVPEFSIQRHPVTVGAYREFVEAGGYDDPSYWSRGGWRWRTHDGISAPRFWGESEWHAYLVDNHPVIGVSAFEAEAYASFQQLALPSVQQWERASRGDDGRAYPWGDEWDANRLRDVRAEGLGLEPVGSYPKGATPEGVLDLAGSVWEWTATESGEGERRIFKGGSWMDSLPAYFRSAAFSEDAPDYSSISLGFRCARDGAA